MTCRSALVGITGEEQDESVPTQLVGGEPSAWATEAAAASWVGQSGYFCLQFGLQRHQFVLPT